MIIRVEYFYWLLGVMLALVSVMSAMDRTNPRRWTTSLFWALYAIIYIAGDLLPPVVAGAMMVVMALLAGFGGVRSGKPDTLPEDQRLSTEQLVADLKAADKDARYIPKVDDIVSAVAAGARRGDLVIVMSNGGFEGIHDKLLAALAARG